MAKARNKSAIPFDLKRVVSKDTSWIGELIANKDQMFSVPVAEGIVEMDGKFLVVNALMWKPLIRRDLPIREVHRYWREEFTAGVQERIHSAMYQDVLTFAPEAMISIQEEMVQSINDIYNVICVYMGAYQQTTDIFSLVQTMEHPDIAAACYVGLDSDDKNINVAETEIKKGAEHLGKILSDPKFRKYNALYPFVRMGAVSPHQLPQVMMAAGTRTDVNDVMIYRAITSSYIRGIGGIVDFAIDSLAAKKSLIYNKKSLPDSRYDDRKQQLLSSIQYRLHPGDCGSTVTVPFQITERNHKPCVGKFIVENGKLIELTYDNLTSYIGKEVHLRSPITCRHTDGCCHVCGGRMTDYTLPDTVIGIASTIELMGPTAQLILSNKHFSTTTSVSYILPRALNGVLEVRRNDLAFLKDHKLTGLRIGVPFSNASKLSDLQYIKTSSALNDQHFSSIEELTIVNAKGDPVVVPTNMIDANGSIPYFSSDMLRYIKANPKMVVETDDMVWISMDKFDPEKAVLSYMVFNASMVRFSQQLRGLFSKSIMNYTDVAEALRDFTNLVYSKLNTHLYHLEVILRSSMVTSEQDASIPQVDDIHNVRFGALRSLMFQRPIGSQLAYQEMVRYMEDPRTFTEPKPPGPFDALAGML